MIGIFSSGLGGLTVAKAVEQLLPQYPLLYLGDTARSPYGTKGIEAVIDYALENALFLCSQGAKIIVISDNYPSAIAADRLRLELPVPVIDLIGPTVRQAVAASTTGRIGVIGSRATMESDVYRTEIPRKKSACTIFSLACPLLLPLIEEGWIDKRETKMILRRYLYPLRNRQIDTLILGCSHYSLLRHLIQSRIGKKVTLIDSSLAVVDSLQTFLTAHATIPRQEDHTHSENRYFVTSLTESTKDFAAQIFHRPLDLETL
jgi:glutamate racemase